MIVKEHGSFKDATGRVIKIGDKCFYCHKSELRKSEVVRFAQSKIFLLGKKCVYSYNIIVYED